MLHRYMCDVLDEIRTALKVGRIDMITGLVEEIQTMGNRMEAKLQEYADLEYRLGEYRELKKKIKAAKGELEEVTGQEEDPPQ